MLFGTSEGAQYCPVLEMLNRGLLQSCEIHVWTRVAISEILLHTAAKVSHPLSLQFRRKQIYRALQARLRNPTLDVSEAVWGIMLVSVFESFTGTQDRLSRHLRTIDRLNKANGGFRSLLLNSKRMDESPLIILEPRWFTGSYLLVENPVETRDELMATRDRFIRSLERLAAWLSRIQVISPFADGVTMTLPSPTMRETNKEDLRLLCSYLYHLIDQQLSAPTNPFVHASAAFFCSNSICMTFVEHDLDARQAENYLRTVQSIMCGSTDLSDRFGFELSSLSVMATNHILALAREHLANSLVPETLKRRDDRWVLEVAVSQAIVDGQRMFQYLPTWLQSKTTRILCRAALVVTDEVGSESLCDATFLRTLHDTITKSWLCMQAHSS